MDGVEVQPKHASMASDAYVGVAHSRVEARGRNASSFGSRTSAAAPIAATHGPPGLGLVGLTRTLIPSLCKSRSCPLRASTRHPAAQQPRPALAADNSSTKSGSGSNVARPQSGAEEISAAVERLIQGGVRGRRRRAARATQARAERFRRVGRECGGRTRCRIRTVRIVTASRATRELCAKSRSPWAPSAVGRTRAAPTAASVGSPAAH